MKSILACLLLVACGGPSRSQLADTPIAKTPRSPSIAPPASSSDDERYQLKQEFDDMKDTRDAYEEAPESSRPPGPPPTNQGRPPEAPPAPSPEPAPAIEIPPR